MDSSRALLHSSAVIPAAIGLGEITSLVGALAWPVVVSAALFYFRDQIADLVGSVGGRIKSVSALGWELELTELHRADITTFAEINELISTPIHEGTELVQIAAIDADYAVIDLGDGKNWLTSYLYISAMLFEQTTPRMRFLVFVSGIGRDRFRFEGVAELSQLRWALARHYPWLEQAFALAYKEVLLPYWPNFKNPPVRSVIIDSRRGMLELHEMQTLKEKFLGFTRQDLLYSATDIFNPQALAAALHDRSNQLSVQIMSHLDPDTRQMIKNGADPAKRLDDSNYAYRNDVYGAVPALHEALVEALNAAIKCVQLSEHWTPSAGYLPSVATRSLIPSKPQGMALLWLNRNILDAAYDRDLARTSMQLTESESGELPYLGEEWTLVRENDSVWRHARWIDASLIERVMGSDLVRSHLRDADLVGKSREDQARLVLSQTGTVVPIVEEGGRFSRLLDRQGLVDAVAREAAS